jgi:hypothetical protein
VKTVTKRLKHRVRGSHGSRIIYKLPRIPRDADGRPQVLPATTFGTVSDPTQRVRASGHENVTAEHGSTFEVTSDDWLTPAGDCILGVEADTVPAAFDEAFVEACRSRTATITATLRADGYEQVVEGRGHPDLTFDGDRSAVCRTSTHVDDRTVMVEADAAAADLDRELVAALADGAGLEFVLEVE